MGVRDDAAYVRWSTSSQADRLTREVQLSVIRRIEGTRGLRIKGSRVYTDDAKHSDDVERPALKRLLAATKAGNIRTLVVAYHDRLLRGTELMRLLLLFFKAHSVEVIFGDVGSVTDELMPMLDMYGAQGAQFLRAVRKKTRDGVQMAIAKGHRVGRPPSGFTVSSSKTEWVLSPAGEQIQRLRNDGSNAVEIRDTGLKYGTGKRANKPVTLTFVKRAIRNIELANDGLLEDYLAEGRNQRRDDWKHWRNVRRTREKDAKRALEDLIPIEYLQERASY